MAEGAPDKPPPSQFLAYGVGSLAHQILDGGVSSLAFYFFNIALGVDPFLVGLAQSLARGVDLVTDPLAGYITDAFRHRFSKRMLIAVGSLVGAISFTLIWLVPVGFSPLAYFLWLLVCFSICSAAWSLFAVPRYALGFEMTADPHERTKLMTLAAFMATSLNLVMCWAYRIIQWPIFGGNIPGARWVGGAMGAGILVFGLVSAFYCREKPASRVGLSPPTPPRSFKSFTRSIWGVVKCRPFLLLASSVAIILIGVIGTYATSPYLIIYYVCGGDQTRGALWIGFTSTSWIVSGIAFTPVVLWLARVAGRKATVIAFLGLALASCLIRWRCYDPDLVWLSLIPTACFGAGIGALASMAPAMTADVCDWDEYTTGRRSGGMFSAFYSWTLKFGMTLGFAVAGLLLDLSGFHAKLGAMPTPAMILRMRVIDSVFPFVMLTLALVLILRYPITTKEMLKVRQSLERPAEAHLKA